MPAEKRASSADPGPGGAAKKGPRPESGASADPPHVGDLLERIPAWQQMPAEEFNAEFDKWLLDNDIDTDRSADFIKDMKEYGLTLRTSSVRGMSHVNLHVKQSARTILAAVAPASVKDFKLVGSPHAFASVSARYVEPPIFDTMESTVRDIRRTAGEKRVVILRGESGCGKTVTAFLAGSDGVSIYVIPNDKGGHDAAVDDPVPSDSLLHLPQSEERDRKVTQALFNHIDALVGDVGVKITVPVTLILDEMGGRPVALRAICSARAAIQTKLKTFTSAEVRIIVAGTGVSQVGYAVGSNVLFFKEIDIRNTSETFDQFLGQSALKNLKKAIKPSEPAGEKRAAEKSAGEKRAAEEAAGANSSPVALANPSPAALALTILAQNRRCAAIIARYVLNHVWWSKSGHELSDIQLWQLFQTTCSTYKLKNGFCDYTADECERAFARAFHICIAKSGTDLTGGDTVLAEKLGLLLDNAKVYDKDEHAPSAFVRVHTDHPTPHVLAYPDTAPRYTMSAAAALLGMSLFGEISGGTWEGFESNIAHVLQIVCASVAHSAVITESITMPTADADGWYTTGAMDKLVKVFEVLVGQPWQRDGEPRVVCRRTHLKLKAIDITRLLKPTFKRSKSSSTREDSLQELHAALHAAFDEGSIVIVVNGPAAKGPDMFVAGRKWYVGVQCKMYSRTVFKTSPRKRTRARKASSENDSSDSDVELDKMELQLPPSELQQRLLLVVAGRKPAAVPDALLKKGDFIYLGVDTIEACTRLRPLCVLVNAPLTGTTRRYVGCVCAFPTGTTEQ